MSNSIFIARGDSLPPVDAVLSDRDGPVDITGATVTFKTNSGLDIACTIMDAAAGQVRLNWGTANQVPAGIHRAWFHVTFGGGATLRFPNYGYIQLVAQE